MSQMKTLIALFPCLKQLTNFIRPFAISSGESWYKSLVPHNITFLKDEKQHKSCTGHSTCCTLLPPIP